MIAANGGYGPSSSSATCSSTALRRSSSRSAPSTSVSTRWRMRMRCGRGSPSPSMTCSIPATPTTRSTCWSRLCPARARPPSSSRRRSARERCPIRRSISWASAGPATSHDVIWQEDDVTTTPVVMSAPAALQMAQYNVKDIQFAQFYDCYTILVMACLEDAGICPKGEIGGFYQNTDTTYKGSFPVNTDGGQISGGQPGGNAGGFRHVVRSDATGHEPGRRAPGGESRHLSGQRLRGHRERDDHAGARFEPPPSRPASQLEERTERARWPTTTSPYPDRKTRS